MSNTHGFTIIEDDYDNVFHFSQRPVMSISSYQTTDIDKLIYIRSLSKPIALAIRIGYIASSPDFIDKVGELKKILVPQILKY